MKSPLDRRSLLGSLAVGLASPAIFAGQAQARSGRPNVLFLCIDDLNDWIEPLSRATGPQLGYPGVKTPNLSALAAMGTTFTSAYAAVPACSPSRTATLLGASADRTGVYFNAQSWQDNVLPGAESLMGYFRAAGWATEGAGKVFHRLDKDLRPSDWDEYWMPEHYGASYHYKPGEISELARRQRGKNAGDFGIGNGEGARADRAVAAWSVDGIKRHFGAGGVFQAVGFYRPHLPFIVPREYFDLYPPGSLRIPPGFLPDATEFTDNTPDLYDLPPRAEELIRARLGRRLEKTGEYWDLVRAYLASVSFADANVGTVLQALRAAGAQSNTYVVLWSDNGMAIGEKLSFKKFTLWERALRVPLMIVGPGIRNQVIDQPVSLIDIYPTLCALVGLPIPDWVNGRDLSETLTTGKPLDSSAAVSVYGLQKPQIENSSIYAKIQTERWNYTRYAADQAELYDRAADPHEWNNLYETEARFSASSELVQGLNRRIGWWPDGYARPVPEA